MVPAGQTFVLPTRLGDAAMLGKNSKNASSNIFVYTPESGASIQEGKIIGAKPVETFANAIRATAAIEPMRNPCFPLMAFLTLPPDFFRKFRPYIARCEFTIFRGMPLLG